MSPVAQRRTRLVHTGVWPALALTYALYVIQPRIGSPTLVIIASVAVTAVAVSFLWAWLSVRGADVIVVGNPGDAMVGDEAPCEITLDGTRGDVIVTMTSLSGQPAVVARAGDRGMLQATAEHRGVYFEAHFEVRSDRPFGWISARRTLRGVPLFQALTVSPRRMPWPAALPDPMRLAQPGAEELRAVRPYVSGDPMKLVHWPTTARSGALVVRELDHPAGTIVVVVDLGDGRRQHVTEGVAGGSAWVIEQLLADGWGVRLVTSELSGTVAEVVDSPLGVGRRLAAAVPGSPTWPGGPDPVYVLAAR